MGQTCLTKSRDMVYTLGSGAYGLLITTQPTRGKFDDDDIESNRLLGRDTDALDTELDFDADDQRKEPDVMSDAEI